MFRFCSGLIKKREIHQNLSIGCWWATPSAEKTSPAIVFIRALFLSEDDDLRADRLYCTRSAACRVIANSDSRETMLF